MIRKIALIITVVSVGFLLYYGYEKMQLSQKAPIDIYTQVSNNAIAIFEINNPDEQWQDLLTNNIIFDELHVFESLKPIEKWITEIDSALTNQKHQQTIEIERLVISIIPFENEYGIIYQIQLDQDIISKKLLETLNHTFNWNFNLDKKSGIIDIKSNDQQFYAEIHNTILTFSTSKLLLPTLREKVDNILSDVEFIRVKNTSSKNTKIRFFLEPNRFLSIVKTHLSEQAQFELALFPTISSWTELDVDIMPDEISMGGFLNGIDSLDHWVTLFKDQEPIKPKVIEVMPDRTAFLLHFGFTDFAKLRHRYVERASSKLGSNHDIPIIRWDTMYDISIQNDFLSWVDTEIALSILEPDQYSISNDVLVWIGSSDAQTMHNALSEMALKVANKNGFEFEHITYKDYSINKIGIPDFLETTLGEAFKHVTENYFIQIEDYIVFANSPSTLQWVIERFDHDKTLSKNPNYKNFSTRISGESNLYLYSNIASSPYIYKTLVNPGLQNEIISLTDWLQKFQVFSIQLSHEDDDLFYVNNYLKYNPVYKKETNTLWESPLFTLSNFKPALVKNHYTQASEIVTQDTNNILYLIDNKGKTLWTKSIDGPIISNIHQIDALRNNKLQLLFNTENKIYIIDRNGKSLDNFPIELPSKATSSVLIADYEETKNYRLLIPTIDGNIFNYGVDGKKVDGWNYTSNENIITQPIEYTKVNSKDYLLCVYDNGSLVALNRKGQVRINFKSALNFSLIGGISVETGTTLSNTALYALTQNNEVVSISYADEKTRIFDIDFDNIQNVQYFDSDSDGSTEIIVSNRHRIAVYKTDGNKIFDIRPIDEINSKISVYNFPDGNKLGYVSRNENKVVLIKLNGNMVYPFPLKGQTSFSIKDINNDGRYNMITVDNEGVLLNYTLDF